VARRLRLLLALVLALAGASAAPAPAEAGQRRGGPGKRVRRKPPSSKVPERALSTRDWRKGSRRFLLYRGVGVPPNRFRTRGVKGTDGNQSTERLWFSDTPSIAGGFAMRDDDAVPYVTVVEVLMPAELFSTVATAPWQRRAHGHVNGRVDRADVPDLAPLIRRIGLVDRARGGEIRWASWREAEAQGWFRRDADYARIFAALPASP
jgi:hypothetical protein